MEKRPQTIVKEIHAPEELVFNEGLDNNPVGFTVYGQTPDRTYEDRDVFFMVRPMANTNSSRILDDPDEIMAMHLRAEDAIKLGQKLVEHGTKALLANMYQHQHIHHLNALQRCVSEGRVSKLVFTAHDEKPVNYGEGFRIFTVQPVWVASQIPEFCGDYKFETIVYWSPFEDEFKQQQEFWGAPIVFVNYDHEAEVAKFNKLVEDSMQLEFEFINEREARAPKIEWKEGPDAAGTGLDVDHLDGISLDVKGVVTVEAQTTNDGSAE